MPLLVCATPIGNLEDVTLRVLRELRDAELVLCEDTRRTRILLSRHRHRGRLMSYERHSEARRTAEVLPLIEEGKRIALVSDAGLPGSTTRGTRLIRAVVARGLEVRIAARAPPRSRRRWSRAGSPVTGTCRSASCRAGRRSSVAVGRALCLALALVALVTEPASEALASLATFDPARPAAVCRELTKRFEEVVRGLPPSLQSGSRSRRRAS